MIEGTVKWFNESKGFGFLSREGGPDVFVHHTEIKAEGFRTLNEGDRVKLRWWTARRGPAPRTSPASDDSQTAVRDARGFPRAFFFWGQVLNRALSGRARFKT